MKHFLPLLFCLIPVSALAQTQVQEVNPCIKQACFVGSSSATVGASGTTTLTVQQPAANATVPARAVQFMTAVVQCPGQSFTVDQSQNGTAATATAGSAIALIPIQQTGSGATVTAAATVWTASNVGAGTAAANTLTFTAGSIAVIDLSLRQMATAGTANNYSVKLTNTGASSCVGTVSIYWWEKF